MNTTNHTLGPWALLDREENSRTLTHITNGAHIVCTLGTTRTDGSPNHSANAHLIAAAPKLLQVLKDLLPEFVDLYERFDPTGEIAVWDQWTQEALEVIAEAEGVK
jgi:hypothetical protein